MAKFDDKLYLIRTIYNNAIIAKLLRYP